MDYMDIILHEEPYWIMEAVLFLIRCEEDELEMFEYEKYGKTKKDVENLLDKYLIYKQEVLQETKELLEKNKEMVSYFVKTKYEHRSSFFQSVILELINGSNVDKVNSEHLVVYHTKEELEEFIHLSMIEVMKVYEVKNTEKDIEGIRKQYDFSNIEGIMNVLSVLDLEDMERWHILNIYNNPEPFYYQLKSFLEGLVVILKRCFSSIKKDYYNQLQRIKETKYYNMLLEGKYGILVKTEPEKMCDVYVTMFGYNSLRYISEEDINICLVGMFFEQITDWEEQHSFLEGQMIITLKALADMNRIKIIKLLAERPRYLQELARELKLTPATVSHHIDVLYQGRLIQYVVDKQSGKKVFYENKKDTLKKMGEIIRSLGE